jgi:hypothetical protein
VYLSEFARSHAELYCKQPKFDARREYDRGLALSLGLALSAESRQPPLSAPGGSHTTYCRDGSPESKGPVGPMGDPGQRGRDGQKGSISSD